MEDILQAELKERFTAAVDSFVSKVKDDPNVIAVIVCGSLAYDVVWEKSDIDMTVVIRDQVLKNTSYCIIEDGITINVYLMVRSDFKRGMERNIGGSFSQSYFSKGKIVYAKDDSLYDYFEDIKKLGSDDIALSAFYMACELVGIYDKCQKWLKARKDSLYAQYYLLKAAEVIANMELCLNGEPSSRESIQKALAINPEMIKTFYQDAMSHHFGEEEIIKAIEKIDNYLEQHLDVLKKPVIEFMSDEQIKTSTIISKHFHMESHFIIGIFDYLADKGVIEKVSQTIRITPKSKLAVEELGYIHSIKVQNTLIHNTDTTNRSRIYIFCGEERSFYMSIRTNIEICGAKQNNLKNISVEIPRDKLTVITGVSGSGKSSLAFDVIYGEGQRRFLDSLSTFAKSRISQLKKAKVDYVRGLSPVIAIEQKKGNNNPRSTVGTVTDINDYMRLLFSTAGVGKCPECGKPLKQLSAAQIAEHISTLPEGTVIELRAPIYKIFGEEYDYTFHKLREKGYKNLMVDGEPFSLSEKKELDESKNYKIELIIDRFTLKKDSYIQLTKSIEAAMIALEEDIMIKVEVIGGEEEKFYNNFTCPEHHFFLCEMQPFHFSFNSPASACHTCLGVGMSYVVEPRFLIVAPEKSINKGALKTTVYNPSGKDSYRTVMMYSLSQKYNFSLDTPFRDLPKHIHEMLFYGTKGETVEMIQPPFSQKRNWITGKDRPFHGFVHELESFYRYYIRKTSTSEAFEPNFIKECMIEKICPECKGARLKPQRLQVTVGGKNIDQLSRMQLPELLSFLQSLGFEKDIEEVVSTIIREISSRLQLLIDIGLHYISLGRRSDSISGGEMQRIKMSTQISSELMGMLYVMDEPSIGLHPRDSSKVIDTMKKLRDIGNTVIVVEHDIDTIRSADHIIEIGPGPGVHGGNIVATGTAQDIMKVPESITGQYLSGEASIPVPNHRKELGDDFLSIQGARENNLKNIDIDIPLGVFVCVTGVSGSGKSSLINEILYKQLKINKTGARIVAGEHDFVFGAELLNNVINIDQTPIGRNSKSNPATYIGIYDKIREIFAMQPEAVARGYKEIDFSLTHANGTRCEHCGGDGIIVTNLQFMADIETVCPVCKGMRFSDEGLEIKYKGKSIADVLEMTVEEALDFFKDNKYLKHKLEIVNELGLGYMRLGQSSTTLSGGEAQRVKLAYELSKIKRGAHNLYILDEPTTGLHLSDIQKLVDCLNKLVDNGHTVLVIEHHLDVIKSADYIIDMGPEGGNGGGYVVAEGTPEQVAKVEGSYTGKFLKKVL